MINTILVFLMLLALAGGSVFGQTTEFTYQGSLKNGAAPASGNYDFEFSLFDAVSGGTQLGSNFSANNVLVTNGIFSVRLNFGDQFPGANRFLEIRVRQTGGGAFTPLTPRQSLTSNPYSVKSLSATIAGNVTGVVAVANGGTGSATQNFVDLGNTQTIGGDKNFSNRISAGSISSATQYDIGNFRILSTPGIRNTFVGKGAGFGNLTGQRNSSVGEDAGSFNTAGNANSFFGYNAGLQTTSSNNSFFGENSGVQNTTGFDNSFFGGSSGLTNGTGNSNSFFGVNAGYANTTGNANAFFGVGAGQSNFTGFQNAFFGAIAGNSNTDGRRNSYFGFNTGNASTTGEGITLIGWGANTVGNLFNSTAIGIGATVSQSNALILGSSGLSGPRVGIGLTAPTYKLHVVNESTDGGLRVQISGAGSSVASFGGTGIFLIDSASTAGGRLTVLENGKTGIGINAPTFKMHVIDTSNAGLRVQTNATGGTVASFGGNGAVYVDAPGVVGGRLTILENGNVGISDNNPSDKLTVAGTIRIGSLGSAGVTQLCQNNAGQISTCSSSIRYKQNVNPFAPGLSIVERLRPVSFNWRANDQADFGLVAEEVAAIEPLLTTQNDKGSVEGVKYDRIGVVLINAVNEQQRQIESQQKQIDEQKEVIKDLRRGLDALKIPVCFQSPAAEICGPKN